MFLKFICCAAFARMAYTYSAASKNTIDLELIPMLAHLDPDRLHSLLMEKIEQSAKEHDYDAIVLGYGLCGNAALGLTSPIPLIIPRMHDCCTMFCGSRDKFIEEFGKCPSMRWSSACYFERSDMLNLVNGRRFDYKTSEEFLEYVEKYGEDEAEELWAMMHPAIETDEAAYISVPGFDNDTYFNMYKEEIDSENKKIKMVEGSTDLFQQLLNGPWDDNEEFLIVRPGQTIVGLYSLRDVMEVADIKDCPKKSDL